MQPAFSASTDLADPASWSRPRLFTSNRRPMSRWIDFWVICDADRAHLFFTSPDGKMWRAETSRKDGFPRGWTRPQVVLQGNLFEASHTYLLRSANRYLTLVEAVGPGGRRYYKAYLADRLAGRWEPLAAERDQPFAAPGNVRGHMGRHWTDSFSHGELLRTAHDERPWRLTRRGCGFCSRE